MLLLLDSLLYFIPLAILEFTGNSLEESDRSDWVMMAVSIAHFLATDVQDGLPPKMLFWCSIVDNIVMFVVTLTLPIGIIAYRVMNPKTAELEGIMKLGCIFQLVLVFILFLSLRTTRKLYQKFDIERNQGQANGGN